MAGRTGWFSQEWPRQTLAPSRICIWSANICSLLVGDGERGGLTRRDGSSAIRSRAKP